MNKNNKEQQIILVSNYGFKYAKDLKLDVSFEQKNATQSPSNLPKVIWEGLVA